jgi:acyl-[acyl-carrier-protein]-phospholipid O-acyltransferase / long-chain-fatty-acid--[acyl-carrier-protein] ligase
MHHNQFTLFTVRRFLPLAITQFLGAFNDNLFKNALVILITYVLAARSGLNAQVLVVLAGGIFILPFFLFSATAGQLADKYDKAWLTGWIKLAEILFMLGAALGFYLNNLYFLMTVLFLMGTHSTFFGPIKYGILPEHLATDELVAGNALIETTTFLAILGGTLLGGLAILGSGGAHLVSMLAIMVAILGWVASRFIPPTQPAAPDLQIGYNLLRETWRIVHYARSNGVIFLCILGISWFWLVGATFLSLLPTLAKDVIGANEQVVTLFLLAFSLGIASGSLLCNRLLKGEIHATYVPLGAAGITLFAVDLYFASRSFTSPTHALMGIYAFLLAPGSLRILVDLSLVAVASGIYIVPLYALLQQRSEDAHRSRNIAANNVINALFMVVGAVVSAALLQQGMSIPAVFLTLALMNAGVVVYISRLLPGALVKASIAWLLDLLFRVDVRGLKHFQQAGDRVLIVANHLSFLDAALIAAYVPDQLTFAIDTRMARHWLIHFFLSLAKTYPLDPTNPLALRALVASIRQGEKVVVFPEGRITVTGALMKIYEGPGMVADKAGAKLLPVRLDGAQYTLFSRLKGKVRMRWFPRISVQFLESRDFEVPNTLKGRARRQYAGRHLYDLMTGMMFESSDYRRTLFASLIDARRTHGAGRLILEDVQRHPLSYRGLMTGSFALGRAISRDTVSGEVVGLLLPNVLGAVVSFFALHAYGRTPALLNYSAGATNAVLACRTAQIRTLYSARRFVEMGRLAELIQAIESSGVRVVYLEDLRANLTILDRLFGLAGGLFPGLGYWITRRDSNPEQPAVVLFTSGTEGAPKGVVLSHRNIQANRYQVASCIDFGPSDIVFNALPLFHSFGLSTGTLLPLLFGLRVFLYPSPLHYRIIPEMVYGTNATLLFGTDTFLAGYARYAHPYDFYSVRFVCSGAERLKDETRQLYSERFGVRIFEGYGATETAPVLAINSPMQSRIHTVGRLLPGIAWRIMPVPGIDEGGRLEVQGPNVMAGYLKVDRPGVLQPPEDGWYDTGDIVALDAEGYVTIKGRLKRFAKVGGEMVSLTAVEATVARLWPKGAHAVVALPDPKKGEQLVLVTDYAEARRDALVAFARSAGIADIATPKTLLIVEALPVLGSGKLDYIGIRIVAEQRLDMPNCNYLPISFLINCSKNN